MTSVALIIPALRPDFTQLVLESITRQSRPPDEVVISEDGQNEKMPQVIEKYQGRLPKLIHLSEAKQGFRASYVRNKGVAQAKSDCLITSDGDLILHQHFVKDLINILEQKPQSFILSSRTYLKKEVSEKLTQNQKLPRSFQFKDLERNYLNACYSLGLSKIALKKIKAPTTISQCPAGGLCAVRRDDYLKVNGYDEAYTGWGREDADFIARLMNAGLTAYKLKFAAITYHLWHPIESRQRLSANDKLLEQTLTDKRVRCQKGLDHHT